MCKRLFLLAGIAVAMACTAVAQKQDTNPGHAPPVFLGGPKYKKDKPATSRSVRGTVADDSGQPLKGALVTLKNDRTGEKQTTITRKDGRYNFDDLSFTVDYEVYAQYKGTKSASKKLSQYDRTPEVVRMLEVASAAKPDASTHSNTQAKK